MTKLIVSNAEGTSGSSTDGGGAVPESQPGEQEKSTGSWHLLWVNAKAEKAVRNRLTDDGFEAFVAAAREIHTWRRGEKRVVERVLIPCVVFVRIEQKDQLTVLRCPGAHSFMADPARKQSGASYWERLARVGDREMLTLRKMLAQQDARVEFATRGFTVGEEVLVRGLGEESYLAQVVRIYGERQACIGVRLSFLGCAYMKVPVGRVTRP